MRLAENTGRKNSQKIAIFAQSHNLLDYIFAIKARIDNRKKNLLNSNVSPTRPHNLVNFDPLAAEILWRVWAPQLISMGFASWQRYCTALYGRQPNFAALNRGRHLYSARRPSRWALAHHILVAYAAGTILAC